MNLQYNIKKAEDYVCKVSCFKSTVMLNSIKQKYSQAELTKDCGLALDHFVCNKRNFSCKFFFFQNSEFGIFPAFLPASI